MVKIKAFPAVRYSIPTLSDIICPPYDIITPEDKKILKRNKYNWVNVELPDGNRFANAKKNLQKWLKEKILVKDTKHSIYIYEQSFELNNRPFQQLGFFAIMKLDPKRKQVIPHEKTKPKPVESRLKLLRKVKVNTSPIFCTYNDSDHKVEILLEKMLTAEKPRIVFKDTSGILRKLWVISNKSFIKRITNLFLSKKVYIADGHHRYSTSLVYQKEFCTCNFILTYFCSMQSSGLLILPTHRVVTKPATVDKIARLIKDNFKFIAMTKRSKRPKEVPVGQSPLTMYHNRKFQFMVPKNISLIKKYYNTDVIVLHELLLKHLPQGNIIYTKDFSEATQIADKTRGIAFLVNSIKVKTLEKIMKSKIILPPKSTYFYPKVFAGIVIYSLK